MAGALKKKHGASFAKKRAAGRGGHDHEPIVLLCFSLCSLHHLSVVVAFWRAQGRAFEAASAKKFWCEGFGSGAADGGWNALGKRELAQR